MRARLQRKCGCAGACGSCREKRELRRSAIDARKPESVPRSVDRVLGSSGAPLDPATRQTLEPRFGHDFSSVRVHTGADAAVSARDVHARAWTVGDHIALGAGQSPRDLRLLAHELTHVVQQSAMPQASSLTVGAANDPAESEADAMASAVMSRAAGIPPAVASRRAERPRVHGMAVIRRQIDPFNYDEDIKAIRTQLQIPNPDMKGQAVPLSDREIAKLEEVFADRAPKVSRVAAGVQPIFILHDTDAGFPLGHTEFEASHSEGPFGIGVAALAPMEHGTGKTAEDPGIRETPRPLYESHRPTTTGWEQALDVLSWIDRGNLFRGIWTAMTPAQRDPFFASGLARARPTEKQTRAAKSAAAVAVVTTDPKADVPDGGSTTLQWMMEAICNHVRENSAAGIVDTTGGPAAATARKEKVTTNCSKLRDWFDERTARIQKTTAVEIVQRHENLPRPTYTEKQYTDVARLYLMSAVEARKWPYIISHWQIDKIIKGGHTDPRCYNVHKLYRAIAEIVGHYAGSIYGMEPKYGTDRDQHNIWWTKPLCHGDPPA